MYGEIGRFEMVAKLGEMELRSPLRRTEPRRRSSARRCSTAGRRTRRLPSSSVRSSATPDSVRVQGRARRARRTTPSSGPTKSTVYPTTPIGSTTRRRVRMLLRAARIVRIEAPEDPRLEELLKRIFAKDIDEPSANFIYETLLATANALGRARGAPRAPRGARAATTQRSVEALRMFALEWVQRFKDRDRGAKFFDAAIKATASNGASPMKSVVAAFTLLSQVQGERGEWSAAARPRRVGDRPAAAGEDKLYVAIQAGHIAFDKVNDIARAQKFFAIAAAIEPQNPNVAGLRRRSSASTSCRWRRARCPTIASRRQPASRRARS